MEICGPRRKDIIEIEEFEGWEYKWTIIDLEMKY